MTHQIYVETPATIGILGAGPIGLEAALYARYLGYDVKLLERGKVGENISRWGHVRMFSPFKMNASPLGLQALAAQDESYRPPDAESYLTGNQWLQRYLLPLSQSDLIADGLVENTRVIAVGRSDCRKGELVVDAQRAESPFRVLVEDAKGQRDEQADVVIDTTGTFGNHRWLGRGGIPAKGELSCEEHINYDLPDILGEAKVRFIGKRTLVIGSGYSAATNIIALAELAGEDAKTEITWITSALDSNGPAIATIPGDRLPGRSELANRANELAWGEGPVAHIAGAHIESIQFDDRSQTFSMKVATESGESELNFDNIIANVGYRPDTSIYEELQIHQCYASEGPMKLAAALLGQSSADCLDQTSAGAAKLLNPEPNFYILGSKSFGRNSNFLVSLGLQQIREAFSIIGGREDLDLYTAVAVASSRRE